MQVVFVVVAIMWNFTKNLIMACDVFRIILDDGLG